VPRMIVDPDFTEHWKTRMLVGLLDGDEAAPVYVLRLWAHCQNRKQSIFQDLHSEALKALCRFPGPANKLESSLVTSGFIRRHGKDLEVVNWSDYNASLIAAWVNGSKGGRNPGVNKTKPRGSRVDESRADKKKPPNPLSIPPPLDTPEFRSSWQMWLLHRHEIGNPLKPTQEAKQIALLENLGSVAACELIDHTISMGWRGLRNADGKDLHEIVKHKHPASKIPDIEEERKTWTGHGGGE
jgi:hypothetical protein